jgi:hypothetical protein
LTFLRGRERNEDSLQRKIGDGLFQTIGRPIWKGKECVDVGGDGGGNCGSDLHDIDEKDHDGADGSEYDCSGPGDSLADYA